MAIQVLDPVTRIEGHLRIDTRVEDGRVTEAWSRGEMFRGFEALLMGRDPLDAPVITQRICGVCPVSHAVASCRCLEDALGITAPVNGRLLRSLVLGANYLQSHVLHFYQLSALDYVDVAAVLAYEGSDPVLREVRGWAQGEVKSGRVLPAAPFLPRLPGDYPADPAWNLGALAHYLQALEVRSEAHEMAALFGGKVPHTAALVPGGVTTGVEPEAVEAFRGRLRRVRRFVDSVYLSDVFQMARRFPAYAQAGRGVDRYLSYGVFEEAQGDWLPAGVLTSDGLEKLDVTRIGEEVTASRFRAGGAKHPSQGVTEPDAHKDGAYSWLKAPRYAGKAVEVGPLARMRVAAEAGKAGAQSALDAALKEAGLGSEAWNSAVGRHLARAVEASLLAARMESWLDGLQLMQPSVGPYQPKATGEGHGLTEAPRGALGHWITVQDGKIARYQCVVPSTWNFSPRGESGEPGPVEAALQGLAVNPEFQGLEVARVVRSFDPCIACAVH